MYQLVPTYPFSKRLSKNHTLNTGYQLEFKPFEEGGTEKQLVVLDIDTPNGLILANYIMAFLGMSRVVKSPKGVHIYYKIAINNLNLLKSHYYLNLEELIEKGIIDEAYATMFVRTNKHASRVYEKHQIRLFPIEVKKKRIMAPGSVVNAKAEKIYRKLYSKGLIDEKNFDAKKFFFEHLGITCDFYTYKLDYDKPLSEGIAELEINRFFSLFKTEKPNQQKQFNKADSFVYSCPKYGNKPIFDYSETKVSDYVAQLVKDNILNFHYTESEYIDYDSLTIKSVEQKMGRIETGRAILCPVHAERKPSVAFYNTKSGIRMFEFHPRTENVSKSMSELLFALLTKREVRMKPGDANFVYILRYNLVAHLTNTYRQVSKANKLHQLVVKLNEIIDVTKIDKRKYTRFEKTLKMLMALASNFLSTFDDDIFSARFASKVLGYSKSTANIIINLLISAGVLKIAGKKTLSKGRKAPIYTVCFSENQLFSIAFRLLTALGLTRYIKAQYTCRKTKIQKTETKIIDSRLKRMYNIRGWCFAPD